MVARVQGVRSALVFVLMVGSPAALSGCGSTTRNGGGDSGATSASAGFGGTSGSSGDAGLGGTSGSSGGSLSSGGSAGAAQQCPVEQPVGVCAAGEPGEGCEYVTDGCPRTMRCKGGEGGGMQWGWDYVSLFGACDVPGAVCTYSREFFNYLYRRPYECSEDMVWTQPECPATLPTEGDPCGMGSPFSFATITECQYDQECVDGVLIATVVTCTPCFGVDETCTYGAGEALDQGPCSL